jgi:uncharacterized protein (TIGR02099 family)
MWSFLNKLAKRLLVVLGVVVILLAVAVGAFRLFIAQLPSYQTELTAWVAAELGLFVRFDQLDARWGLRGPELTLRNVRIANSDGTDALVTATRAGVGLDAWALFLERRPRVNRLSVDGLGLTIERGTDGRYRLAGARRGDSGGAGDLDALIPRAVEVTVRDSRIQYVDAVRRQSWRFDDVTMTLTRTAGALSIDARAVPPPELASSVELAVDATLATQDSTSTVWRVFSDLQDVDLATLARLLPTEDVYAITGAGDATLWFDWAGGRVVRANASVGFSDVTLPNPATPAASAFQQVELTAEWLEDARGWQLAVSDVDVSRNGRRWSSGGNTELVVARADDLIQSIDFSSDFVRLDDLMPIVFAFAEAPLAQQWLELDPRGELRDVDFSVTREASGEWEYSLAVQFDGLALAATAGRPGIDGLSGAITTGTRSGTVELKSTDVTFDWPELFASPLAIERLTGSLVWRQGRDVVRMVSNDLALGVLGSNVQSSLELTLPLDGSAAHLDIESTAARVDLVAAKQFLPVYRMPRAAVAWLERAVQGGEAHNVELNFFGPVDAFPFDHGEGQFRVTADVADVALEFIDDWPRAEELNGTIEFVNASFNAAGRGRILGNRGDSVGVEIAELRNAVLRYESHTVGPLADVIAFLRAADQLGPGYERLRVHSGTGVVDVGLDVPLRNRAAFELDARLGIVDGELSIEGFGPHASEINGMLEFDGRSVSGRDLEAIFLGGPVSAAVVVPEEEHYRAALEAAGETTADGVLAAFNLPYADRFAGQTQWQGRLLLPDRAATADSPLRVDVQSNLTGVSLKFPAPFEKTPSDAVNLQLAFAFPSGGLEVDGNLGASRRFALHYARDGRRFAFRRGAVQFGGNLPELPDEEGLVVRGSLTALDLDEWLAFAGTPGTERTRPLLLGAQLELSELSAFGQQLGMSRLDARREAAAWNVDIASEAIAGNVMIPRSLTARPQIVASMQRVYLEPREGGDGVGLDPRTLPGLSLHADQLGVGARRFGRVDADIVTDPLGLRLVSFTSATESFAIEGGGSWLVGPDGAAMTRVAVGITSDDVGTALDELGLGAFMGGEMADLTASVYWAGPPSGKWLEHVDGDVAVRIETGSLLEIDPGAGRVVGLLSIAALPRRLALDFRDVFNRGFVFDEITGDFTLIDGNAYTDNLKMSGPGAEIGVIGRTGLRDRDYQQQAVVTADPSNMLPTVGALVAGPGVGAAWLLFTRIFKEPLKGIGRASYCVTGTWDAPAVERLSGDEVDEAEQCAALPPNGFGARLEGEN